MMSKKRGDRQQSWELLLKDIDNVIAGKKLAVKNHSINIPYIARNDPPPRQVRRPMLKILLTASVLLNLILFAYFLSREFLDKSMDGTRSKEVSIVALKPEVLNKTKNTLPQKDMMPPVLKKNLPVDLGLASPPSNVIVTVEPGMKKDMTVDFGDGVKIDLVLIQPGTFMMGKEARKVTLTKPFYIGKHEVTQAQWQAVTGYNPSYFKNGEESGKRPVEGVTWDDINSNFLPKLEGRMPKCWTVRLPTEAEWEYSCRAGTEGDYAGALDAMGWYKSNSGGTTHPVGQKKANAWGLYDMYGNVWELCRDWHGKYPDSEVTDPTGPPSGAGRVIRGGSCDFDAMYSNSVSRDSVFTNYNWRGGSAPPPPAPAVNPGTPPGFYKGFRLVVDILNDTKPEARPVDGKDWTVPDIRMEFIWIKSLSSWVGKYEVTNGEYRKFKPAHDSKSSGNNSLNDDRQPVTFVNYGDATEYAKWLTETERKSGRLPAGYSYRLPTNTEWTTFCQCGDNREYPWGSSMPPKYGNYGLDGYYDSFTATCPVEQSGRNDWGQYGVGGNVWECTVKSSTDLSFDAWRGASWQDSLLANLRSSYRLDNNALGRYSDRGFRLVLVCFAVDIPVSGLKQNTDTQSAMPQTTVSDTNSKKHDSKLADTKDKLTEFITDLTSADWDKLPGVVLKVSADRVAKAFKDTTNAFIKNGEDCYAVPHPADYPTENYSGEIRVKIVPMVE
jgi:formylglycine-generating enzyme required for sulfatase activity